VSGLSFTAYWLDWAASYFWRVRALSSVYNTSDWSFVWKFTTEQEIPGTPLLVSPANDSTDAPITLNFDWEEVTNADYYEMQCSQDSFFVVNVITDTVVLSGATLGNLAYNAEYFWRVRALGAVFQPGQWSEVWSFYTQPAPAPQLLSPADDSTGLNATIVTLDWKDVEGITSYEYRYSEDSLFGVFTNGMASESETDITGLGFLTSYYWSVRCFDGTGYSDWSVTWSFTTASLNTPVLLLPENDSAGAPLTVTLAWEDLEDAVYYRYEYGQDSTFSVATDGTTSDTTHTTSVLFYQATYYWHIQGFDGSNWSDWSEIWSFTTETMPAPILILPENDSAGAPLYITFSWDSVTDITVYEYEYAPDPVFSDPVSGTVAQTTATSGLMNYQTVYYWHVRCYSGGQPSQWSETRHFTTDSIPVPVLYTPENDSLDAPVTITFTWDSIPYIEEYEYEYSTDSVFVSFSSAIVTDTTTTVGPLEYDTVYFWHVRAWSGTEVSGWSEMYRFTTMQDTPVAVCEYPERTIRIYPNPSSGQVTIAGEYDRLIVRDAMGRKIYTAGASGAGTNRLDLEWLNDGMYVVEVRDAGYTGYAKLIIRH
ncbi:MAG: T9SS type A sorting domain-containing protein, partial [Bacteroidetes bacterium]|nr:T9SS type A sorting domain-containing protein [Bacteroidota bacterium]